MNNKKLSIIFLIVIFIYFLYVLINAILITNKRRISTSNGIYTNNINSSKSIKSKAYLLTKDCEDTLCRVDILLNYVTNIPYKINKFKAHSPQKTIKLNYGDCDDKSNLLISMLYALNIESYFVLVPKHIFIIVALDDDRLKNKNSFRFNEKKYYILETTAKNSFIGFPFKYELSDINIIFEPFKNKKVKYNKIEYR